MGPSTPPLVLTQSGYVFYAPPDMEDIGDVMMRRKGTKGPIEAHAFFSNDIVPLGEFCGDIFVQYSDGLHQNLQYTVCGAADFDEDGDSGTDLDIDAFFDAYDNSAFTGMAADFNGDGVVDVDDVAAFFRVLSGG